MELFCIYPKELSRVVLYTCDQYQSVVKVSSKQQSLVSGTSSYKDEEALGS